MAGSPSIFRLVYLVTMGDSRGAINDRLGDSLLKEIRYA